MVMPNWLGRKLNFYLDRGGVIHIISGGLANHAGKGVRSVLDEVRNSIAPSGTAASRGLHDEPPLG